MPDFSVCPIAVAAMWYIVHIGLFSSVRNQYSSSHPSDRFLKGTFTLCRGLKGKLSHTEWKFKSWIWGSSMWIYAQNGCFPEAWLHCSGMRLCYSVFVLKVNPERHAGLAPEEFGLCSLSLFGAPLKDPYCKSARLVTKKLQVRIPAGVVGSFSSPEFSLCADSYPVSVPPHVTAVACIKPKSFCQKCSWHVTPKHAYTLDPTKLGWADYAIIWKQTDMQLVREHFATVISARWSTWTDPGLKSGKTNNTKKVRAGNDWLNFVPKSSQAV